MQCVVVYHWQQRLEGQERAPQKTWFFRIAAAGALEAGFCILALEQGWIPGCAGFKKLDPDIPIAPVTQKTQIEGHFALSTSMGFGGCDAALVIESPEQEGDI